MDRLPEELRHRILSFLSPEKVAETSVLSKAWFRTWSTYPDFVFSQSNIAGRSKLAKYVDDNLLRYSKHNLFIDKFVLDFAVLVDLNLASQIEKWLGMVVNNNMAVKHLFLRINFFHIDFRREVYSFPTLILASNRLTSLRLEVTRFSHDQHNFTRFVLGNQNSSIIKCYNLKSLVICSVYLGETMFQSICSSCPLIERIELKDCWGLKTIRVHNLRKLLYLNVAFYSNGIVHLTETPSLEKLCISSLEMFNAISDPFTITSFSSQALKYIHLCDLYISDEFLCNLVSQCPLLEHLHLKVCHSLERVHLLSRTLKNLIIETCQTLVEASIDAPNLLFVRYVAFVYGGRSFSFKSLSEKFKSTVDILVDRDLDVSSFVMIKDMLAKLNCCELLLRVYSRKICFNIKDAREIPLLASATPRRIHTLRIRNRGSQPLTYSGLVNGLFWSFHPEIVEARFPEEIDYEFLRFLCKELMECRTSSKCCTTCDHQVMCWRHCLNHVQVECLERVDRRRTNPRPQRFNWKRLVDGSMNPKLLVLRFKFNWIDKMETNELD